MFGPPPGSGTGLALRAQHTEVLQVIQQQPSPPGCHTGRTEAEEMEPKECPASFLFPSSKDIMATDIPKSVEKGTMVGRVSPEGQEAQESRYHQGCVNQRLTGGRGRRKFERISRGRGGGTILSGPSF